jgi:hypothetical protein
LGAKEAGFLKGEIGLAAQLLEVCLKALAVPPERTGSFYDL